MWLLRCFWYVNVRRKFSHRIYVSCIAENIAAHRNIFRNASHRNASGPPRLFNKLRPSLIEFAEIVEEESRYYATKLNDIRQGRERMPKYEEITIPIIPEENNDYKQNM